MELLQWLRRNGPSSTQYAARLFRKDLLSCQGCSWVPWCEPSYQSKLFQKRRGQKRRRPLRSLDTFHRITWIRWIHGLVILSISFRDQWVSAIFKSRKHQKNICPSWPAFGPVYFDIPCSLMLTVFFSISENQKWRQRHVSPLASLITFQPDIDGFFQFLRIRNDCSDMFYCWRHW